MQDATDITVLERRIAAAFDRIGEALDKVVADAGDADLHARIAVERDANAQLTERLRAVKAREAEARAALEARIAELTQQIDAQGIELQRLKKTAVQLRETLRAQTDAAAEATSDPQLVNRALLAEVEALRALRQTEAVELGAILSELAPLVAEAEHGGRADA